ncbi:MAG: PEP-CTERM sorting domain-containing protein [Pyrinomonadaceae bacterium MAG19_C2-C3]|nr:PEP-CTERM sorting domain-containing protein [Pyrinomonadaceae bacterium MAG19_C2-C3]
MTTLISGTIKTFALCFIALVCLTLTQVEARADEVTVSGTTTGSFSNPAGISFTPGSFTATTANGVAVIGGNTSTTTNGSNFGAITLPDGNTSFDGRTFTLVVTVTAPAGITGGNPATFNATLTGTITNNPRGGGVIVTFTNPSQSFTFNNGTTSGAFSLTVQNVFVFPGQTAEIRGILQGSQTGAIPEPATLILLGTGLTGVAARIRKRRKNANAASIS